MNFPGGLFTVLPQGPDSKSKELFLKETDLWCFDRRLLCRFIKEYGEGEAVFCRGERGDRMFYILSGSVTISGEAGPIRTMGPGEYFGEMSMLLDTPRTATGTAMAPATLLVGITGKILMSFYRTTRKSCSPS